MRRHILSRQQINKSNGLHNPLCKIRKSAVDDSRGMVAIFSVLMIMGIIGLLTIGFSNMVRRAQQRALDEHLSNQAFYAAESGVNMVVGKLDGIIKTGGNLGGLDKTDCGPHPSSIYSDDDYKVDGDNNIKLSCVMVSTTVPNVTTTPTSSGTSNYIKVSHFLDIKWDSEGTDVGDHHVTAGAPELPSKQDWANNVDILKVELIPDGGNDGDYVRQHLVDNSYIFYLYPVQSGGVTTPSVDTSQKGQVIPVNCGSNSYASNTFRCNVAIDGVASGNYQIRQTAMYGGSVTSEVSTRDVSGTAQSIDKSQMIIDSTGKANDVMRRIQARININPASIQSNVSSDNSSLSYESYAIFSGDRICKLYKFDGRNVGDSWQDACESANSSGTVESASTDNGGGIGGIVLKGSSAIGEYPPSPVKDPNEPAFNFSFTMLNSSDDSKNNGKVASCTWDFGDGSSRNLPPERCKNGYAFNHVFEDTSLKITQTNGEEGCRKYYVTLTMYFLPEFNMSPEVDTVKIEAPRGLANDGPEPDRGIVAGICYGKYRKYIP